MGGYGHAGYEQRLRGTMGFSAKRGWASEGSETSAPGRGGNFAGVLTENIRKTVSGLTPPQVCAPGTKLFLQGALPQEVYFISRGLVKLVRVEAGGREFIVDLRFPDWFLGAASVIVQQRRPVTAITLSECHLHHVPVKAFFELLETNTQLSLHLHRLHSQGIIDQIGRMAQLSCLSAQERLENLLWQLSSALRSSDSIAEVKVKLPLKHWEVAQLIAVTPEYLCRLLKKMGKEGVIRQERGWIIVSDFRRLWHPSGEDPS